jgi:hypothetical protein
MKRRLSNDTIANFQAQLNHELWEPIFDEKDVNQSFNLFLNTLLRIFYPSFPLIPVKYMWKKNLWNTPGMVRSCKYK